MTEKKKVTSDSKSGENVSGIEINKARTPSPFFDQDGKIMEAMMEELKKIPLLRKLIVDEES